MGTPVTDPNILAELNGTPASSGKAVTDPNILAELEGSGQKDTLLNRIADPLRPIGKFIGDTSNQAMETGGFKYTPIGMSFKAQEYLQKPFDYAGEKLTEKMGGSGIPGVSNPYWAATAGFITQNLPIIAQAALMPNTPTANPSPMLEGSATGAARTAIGYPPSMLKGNFARGQAAQAARTALENDIIPWSGNPETILRRAEAMGTKSGNKLGEIRSSVGPQSLDPVFNKLDNLKRDLTQGGSTGGNWDIINSEIENAKATLQGLYKGSANQPLYESPPPQAVKAKSILSLPAPKEPGITPGPVRIQPVPNVEPDLYMKEFKPGQTISAADLKRFSKMGWDKVGTTEGSIVYADPSYLASLQEDFNAVGNSFKSRPSQPNVDFPKGNADYYGADVSPKPEPIFQPRSIDRVDLNAAEAAKKQTGKNTNYLNESSKKTGKAITKSTEAGIEQILRDNGVDMEAYNQQKRIYGSAKSIQKAADREVSMDQGKKWSGDSLFGTVNKFVTSRVAGPVARGFNAISNAEQGLINNTPTIGSAGKLASVATVRPTEAEARKIWAQVKSEGLRGEEAKKRARELANQ